MRRLLPAVGLFFLAPLVAEFLLGNLPITMLSSLLVLAPMYGGGALVIREVVRRASRGWPSILVLALAFGILEEGFMTQSLFNPNYLGLNLHLLQPAYMPSLGIGAWWTVFVLTLHTVWSVSVSIALAESCVPDLETSPWLGRVGLAIVAVLFVIAAVAIISFTIKHDRGHFTASVPQFASAAVLCAVLISGTFILPVRKTANSVGSVPHPWVVGLIGLLAGSTVLLIPSRWDWWAVAAYLVLDAATIAAVLVWSRRKTWNARHRLALAGGAALAYAWHAFVETPAVGRAGMANRIGNGILAIGAIVLLAFAARKVAAFTGAADD